jgi:choline dehydrogenase-like flavoprotein
MATTTELPPGEFDFLIVGGGTAGCVIASRLAEYLPHMRILLVEAGPSDFMDDRVLLLKDWLSLLGGELDYDYPTTEQPMGMYDRFLLWPTSGYLRLHTRETVSGRQQCVICKALKKVLAN